ncbi:REP-associated tyrosine transposase [Neobacillus sp. LXY-4]|uniref:REP-associated tyrosine transposase n=1 Tax=Neobacillus sp. LXY-4 TaxID=3379826 RepID=UPI003EE3343B
MPREARRKSRTGIYHVIIRGANRQEIFHDDEDCFKFLDIIGKYKTKSEMNVYAWCLMNNHVHLLLKEGSEDLSITMKRIGVSFVYYYNLKYRTTGHLFQDRYKSENVETNQYLFRVIRYIHQNPLKAGMVGRVHEWRWSSYHEYYGRHDYPIKLLDADFIFSKISPDLTIAKDRFKEFNERHNEDKCLEDELNKRRLTDEEARIEIKKLLGEVEIAHVKSLPKVERNGIFKKLKGIEGLSQRQSARILGVSVNLIRKAQKAQRDGSRDSIRG